mmetsp:Transcript_6577/g.13006  ORF Transcript_6577/g.13006 Transcript_6577/m.13006 type:complete len:104 (-) Transcript_6577:117-428(-)
MRYESVRGHKELEEISSGQKPLYSDKWNLFSIQNPYLTLTSLPSPALQQDRASSLAVNIHTPPLLRDSESRTFFPKSSPSFLPSVLPFLMYLYTTITQLIVLQ